MGKGTTREMVQKGGHHKKVSGKWRKCGVKRASKTGRLGEGAIGTEKVPEGTSKKNMKRGVCQCPIKGEKKGGFCGGKIGKSVRGKQKGKKRNR